MVFASSLAHDLNLHIELPAARLTFPCSPTPPKAALVLKNPLPDLPPARSPARSAANGDSMNWDGPRFHLVSAGPEKWDVAADDQSALIVGREDKLHIQGDSTLCVSAIDLSGNTLTWESPKPDTLVVSVPMTPCPAGYRSLSKFTSTASTSLTPST